LLKASRPSRRALLPDRHKLGRVLRADIAKADPFGALMQRLRGGLLPGGAGGGGIPPRLKAGPLAPSTYPFRLVNQRDSEATPTRQLV